MNRQFIRYVMVGGMAFCVEIFSFYILALVLRMSVTLANILSFGLALLTSFSLNRLWTFAEGTYDKRMHQQLGRYVFIGLMNLFITVVLVEFFRSHGLAPLASKVFATGLTALWNFLLFRSLVFTRLPETASID